MSGTSAWDRTIPGTLQHKAHFDPKQMSRQCKKSPHLTKIIPLINYLASPPIATLR